MNWRKDKGRFATLFYNIAAGDGLSKRCHCWHFLLYHFLWQFFRGVTPIFGTFKESEVTQIFYNPVKKGGANLIQHAFGWLQENLLAATRP